MICSDVLSTKEPSLTVPREQQISLDLTPYYHCTTRCVRRAFLCGADRYTGKNFDHRKRWLEARLVLLSSVFAIDLAAYAIMSNHYHVVLRINAALAKSWPDETVIDRWQRLFSVPTAPTLKQIELWRSRLSSISWYMRCLNEPLARISNREDGCKGRFWEGRFRCQALLDEEALLKCMVYVDLNPIRACSATSPETSYHTSIRARIERNDAHLIPMRKPQAKNVPTLPVRHHDYLELVDWTGRHLNPKKRGRVSSTLPPILIRLNTTHKTWLKEMTHYGRWYYRAVGTLANMERYCQHLGQQWLKGQSKIAAIGL